MKKLMFSLGVALLSVASVHAASETLWSTWFDDDVAKKNVRGCVLGLATEVKNLSGAQIAPCANMAADVKAGCQLAIGYNKNKTLRNGVQLAFVNNSENAALQLGLICINDKGFLPFFVFFNFNTAMFGEKK